MSEAVATQQQGQAGKYRPYPEYKDSGVEWLGIIPTHWSLHALKRTVSDCSNGIWGDEPNGESDLIVLRVADFDRNKLTISDDKLTYRSISERERKTRLLKKGDLLIEKSGGGEKTLVGCVVLFDKEYSAVTSNFVAKMSPREAFCSNFLSYAFSHLYAGRVNYPSIKQTTGIQNLDSESYLMEHFCFPDSSEQQTIAAFLDYETARIDRLIAKQQQLIELLKEKRQAVISHAVTKGLNPNAPMKNSGVEWLGQVPEHWAVMRLKHLIKSLESGCSVNAADVPAKEDELGVLKTSCVYTRRFRASENKTVVMEDFSRVKCPVRKGAIIISRMNTPELVGASALVDTDASNLFLPDRLWQTIFNDQFEVNPEFLAHFMTVEGFRNQISLSAEGASSSMQNIAKEDYLAINALLPLLEEQIEIVDYIKESEARFLRLEAQAMNAIELMKERRIALISAAVTGKIDLRGWTQPAEEVAA